MSGRWLEVCAFVPGFGTARDDDLWPYNVCTRHNYHCSIIIVVQYYSIGIRGIPSIRYSK